MRIAFLIAVGAVLALVQAGEPPALVPVPVRIDARANVRFAPSTSAKIVVTLPADSEVEVFGPAKDAPDWFVIRFPREGRVWVHTRNLKPLDGGQRYQVTQPKTPARDDARINADVVVELDEGAVVEDRGQLVGDWRAVAIPDAIAYVHKKVLKLPPDFDARLRARKAAAESAERAWQQATTVYARYREQVQANPKAAIGIDWATLMQQLDIVISDHASASVRVAAARLRESIAQLIPPAQKVAEQAGIPPPALSPPPPSSDSTRSALAAPALAAPQAPTAAATASTEAPPRPASSQKGPPAHEELRLPPAPAAPASSPPPPGPWQAEGWLVFDDAYQDRVGTRIVLIDEHGEPVAFIRPREGVDLRASELVHRFVGAAGEAHAVLPEQSGLPRPVRLIIATELAPLP